MMSSNDPHRSCSKEKEVKIRDPTSSTISFFEYSNRHLSRGFEENQGGLLAKEREEESVLEENKGKKRQSRACSLEKGAPPKKVEEKKGHDRHAPKKTDSRTKQKQGNPYAIVVERNQNWSQCSVGSDEICLNKPSFSKVSGATGTDSTSVNSSPSADLQRIS
ncbi:uncharacterized protein LOC106670961 [Cimex lectularius]|uniref:Uncharacterized protein n=1 Tax=Cimex lectularius TaxID=79782 RepID=A0A8I6S4T8_CIMLE|nr:uncharacterized protein LOC106670961 [Cimex lectularius]XP_014257157.1 uncharacterized protein LOC106670961 [Cimex lectularius]